MPAGEGRVALVTGASSGIGKATAAAFVREGYTTVAADVREPAGKGATPGRFMRCDVSDEDNVRDLITQIVAELGRLDVAFNNAGILGELGPTADCSTASFDQVIAVNLRGTWLCLREELRQMARQETGGAIVNCSSVAGLVGLAGATAYVASKHGVVGLTRTAALEYARTNVRVNAVCPGPIETPMLEELTAGMPRQAIVDIEPAGRVGAPEEIAAAVLWLCSPAASFVTGQAIAIDGGWTVQ